MTFIYDDDPYSLEIFRMCENALPTTVKAFKSYLITDRQTDRHDQNYMPRFFAGNQ